MGTAPQPPQSAPQTDPRQIEFAYRRRADQDAAEPPVHPVVVVGAGPVGLSLAIDLAQRGQPVVLLDNDHRLSTGSRAICFAKRTLEIFDRLGVGDAAVAAGVSWSVGRVFFGAEPVYRFDLLPEPGHGRPAFINLPQYTLEALLVDRAAALPELDLRWRHAVAGIESGPGHVVLTVETPEGPYRLKAAWVAACDGSRSPLRGMLGLEASGRTFHDRFLIADVRIDEDLFPSGTERWFWFDPPFHPGQSVLLHRQPGQLWRIDFQLGWDADPDAERQPERIVPRVQALLRLGFGREVPFTLDWASVYTFACRRMASFRHDRVLFAGDAAHGVSPFGARGANSGVQDADNLGWKIDAVLRGEAPELLLDTYGAEREPAADENIGHSTRATDFITPKSAASRLLRDEVLHLSRHHAFARRLVNSGRLSLPSVLDGSPLSTLDAPADGFGPALRPGSPPVDAPLTVGGRRTWLLRELDAGFTLLVFGPAPAWASSLPVAVLALDGDRITDAEGLAAARWGARQGTAYLLRPDGHVAARWRQPDADAVRQALDRARGAASGWVAVDPGMPAAVAGVGNEAEQVHPVGLITEPHLDRPDEFYSALLAAHHGLDEAGSGRLNARLALLLANHIGRADVLHAALDAARTGLADSTPGPASTHPPHRPMPTETPR